MITTRAFWSGALERALKTFFQTFVAVVLLNLGSLAIGIDAGLTDVAWVTAASVAGLAALLSVATSIGNADFTAGVQQPAPPAPDTVVVNQPQTTEAEVATVGSIAELLDEAEPYGQPADEATWVEDGDGSTVPGRHREP